MDTNKYIRAELNKEISEYLYTRYCPVCFLGSIGEDNDIEISTSLTGAVLVNEYITNQYGKGFVMTNYYAISGSIEVFIGLLHETYDDATYDEWGKSLKNAIKDGNLQNIYQQFADDLGGGLLFHVKCDNSMNLLEYLWKYTDICPYNLEGERESVIAWYMDNYPSQYQKALDSIEE